LRAELESEINTKHISISLPAISEEHGTILTLNLHERESNESQRDKILFVFPATGSKVLQQLRLNKPLMI
jgi:hypothetical protein